MKNHNIFVKFFLSLTATDDRRLATDDLRLTTERRRSNIPLHINILQKVGKMETAVFAKSCGIRLCAAFQKTAEVSGISAGNIFAEEENMKKK